jgi:hypothetical protein
MQFEQYSAVFPPQKLQVSKFLTSGGSQIVSPKRDWKTSIPSISSILTVLNVTLAHPWDGKIFVTVHWPSAFCDTKLMSCQVRFNNFILFGKNKKQKRHYYSVSCLIQGSFPNRTSLENKFSHLSTRCSAHGWLYQIHVALLCCIHNFFVSALMKALLREP